MKNKVITYLRKKEWNMGNGQCPDCYGVPESWLGHPCYLNGESIGHKLDCPLAAALKEQGEIPLMLGDFTPEVSYESYISDSGIYGTRPKTVEGCPRIKAQNEEMIKILFDKFTEIFKDN